MSDLLGRRVLVGRTVEGHLFVCPFETRDDKLKILEIAVKAL